MSLVSLATVKEILQISHTKEDTWLQIQLDGVENFLSQFLGVRFNATAGAAAVTEDVDGGGEYLFPSEHPVLTVTSVTDLITSALEATSLYVYNDRRIWKLYGGTWLNGDSRWRVIYTAGYQAADLPTAIQGAILQMMYRAHYARGGRRGAGSQGYYTDWSKWLESDIRAMLKPFQYRSVIG
jgi:hypothetical protein